MRERNAFNGWTPSIRKNQLNLKGIYKLNDRNETKHENLYYMLIVQI